MNHPGETKDKKRHRSLSREELELWREVTRSVARLARAPAKQASRSAPAHEARQEAPASPAPVRPALPGYTPAPNCRTAAPALAPLDRRLRKKLARGQAPVDDLLDLHGLRQDEAHVALRSFLAAAQSRDARMVLIVTGKGLRSNDLNSWPGRSGGVLYHAVPHWLSSVEFRRIVAGFDEADTGHGGAGALYVRLRRADRATRYKPDGDS